MRSRFWCWLPVWYRKSLGIVASWSHLSIPLLHLASSLLKNWIQRLLGRSRHCMQGQMLIPIPLVGRRTMLFRWLSQSSSCLLMLYLCIVESLVICNWPCVWYLSWSACYELFLVSLLNKWYGRLMPWRTLILLLGEPGRWAGDPCWSSLTMLDIRLSSCCHDDRWIRSNLASASRSRISHFLLIELMRSR